MIGQKNGSAEALPGSRSVSMSASSFQLAAELQSSAARQRSIETLSLVASHHVM